MALRPRLQRALLTGDASFLRSYVADRPRVRLRAAARTFNGSFHGPGVAWTAKLKDKPASVTVVRPLDRQLLTELSSAARVRPPDRLVLFYNRHAVAGAPVSLIASGSPADPRDVQIGDTTFRAYRVGLADTDDRAAVAAARPRASIDDSGGGWWSAVIAALVTLGTVGLLAYLVAPVVAGRRWVRRLLPSELEDQYAVDPDGGEPFAAPVPSHGAARATGDGAVAPVEVAGSRRIIVIDDDPDERSLLAEALEPDGADVAATGDAEQGLGLLGIEAADLAILDWQMSGRSGAEILAELNIRHPDLPVLVVADELEPQQRHVATLLGADDFVIRPLELDDVVAKAKQLLTAETAARTGE